MRFKGLDLNLLVAMDALLETRSVSLAAKRMGLSQPAMSAALGRLREYFGDDILVATGKRMYPTAYAETLLPQLRACLRDLDLLVSSSTTFDPATTRRSFTIIASDYVTAAVVVPLASRLAEIAPGVSVGIMLPSEESLQHLVEGVADLIITPEQNIHAEHPAELLFEERHVVVGWQGHPIFRRPMTEEAIFGCGQVAVSVGAGRTAAFADRQLAILGKARRIEVTAASFTSVPWLLLQTQRLAFMHERLARAMADYFPITFAPIPFDFPMMRQMIQHHAARSHDEGLTWLRRQIAEVAAAQEEAEDRI